MVIIRIDIFHIYSETEKHRLTMYDKIADIDQADLV